MTTNAKDIMCRCAELTDRGCFVHAWQEPRLVMAFALGKVGATLYAGAGLNWTEAEGESYRMGIASATGRYPRGFTPSYYQGLERVHGPEMAAQMKIIWGVDNRKEAR